MDTPITCNRCRNRRPRAEFVKGGKVLARCAECRDKIKVSKNSRKPTKAPEQGRKRKDEGPYSDKRRPLAPYSSSDTPNLSSPLSYNPFPSTQSSDAEARYTAWNDSQQSDNTKQQRIAAAINSRVDRASRRGNIPLVRSLARAAGHSPFAGSPALLSQGSEYRPSERSSTQQSFFQSSPPLLGRSFNFDYNLNDIDHDYVDIPLQGQMTQDHIERLATAAHRGPVDPENWQRVKEFHASLMNVEMVYCARCKEEWIDIKISDGVSNLSNTHV
ncbi:hypothetical protein BKA64DRAFT_663036 [Cadophora sp. MPI-SDFR-AT-0126]|nr:hypothetical protein BKA64DRAFT_663036 [Leotiomycetes sp. MPI-SDFR-AT-0126]